MGPSLLWHVWRWRRCGIQISHGTSSLGPLATSLMKTLGNPEITPDLKRTIIEGVTQEATNHSVEQLAQKENELLLGLLSLRAKGD